MGKVVGLEGISGYLEERALDVLFDDPRLAIKKAHIQEMTEIAMQIADGQEDVDKDLLRICCLHHDDGRAPQMKFLGNFNDRELTHNALGLDMLDRYLMANKVSMTPEIQILRDVIYYHGRMLLGVMDIPAPSQKYVEIASDADDIENGCIGAVGYLADEADSDAKGYNKDFPEWQGKIKPELFGYFERGEWFDKIKNCHSYSEYILFAATLAMKSIKKYGEIVKKAMLLPSYGYPSALAGYVDIFHKYMSPDDAERASKILEEACK